MSKYYKAYSFSTASIFSTCLVALSGCVDRSEELEPRVDTRPLVSEIRLAELDWGWVAGQRWMLNTIDGQPPIEGTAPWVIFREHTWLEGEASCNRFTASYVRKAEAGLSVSQILSTKMLCPQPDGTMQQEARFYHLLQQTDAYHAEPDRLDMYVDGAVVLSFVNTISDADESSP